MLISRAINIEKVDVNLEKGSQETASTQSACLRASFGVRCYLTMNDSAKEILLRFEKSWTDTERFFDLLLSNGFESLIPLKEFILEQKENGENRHFRIGTSLYRLIYSRSVEHGLRPYQKRITIDTVDNHDYIVTYTDGVTKYLEYRLIDLHDERLTILFKTLKDTLVD